MHQASSRNTSQEQNNSQDKHFPFHLCLLDAAYVDEVASGMADALGLYSQYKLKNRQPEYAKRMVKKLDYACGASLSEYMGTGRDKDEQLLEVIFVRENLSCSSTVEVPYYSVDYFPAVCIYCGVTGTKRTLNESVEKYPKCNSWGDKPDITSKAEEEIFSAKRPWQ